MSQSILSESDTKTSPQLPTRKSKLIDFIVGISTVLFVLSIWSSVLLAIWLALIIFALFLVRFKVTNAKLILFIIFTIAFYPSIHFFAHGDSGFAFWAFWNVRIYFAIFIFYILFMTLSKDVQSLFFLTYFIIVTMDYMIWFLLMFSGIDVIEGWNDSHRSMGMGDRPSISAFIHVVLLYTAICYFKENFFSITLMASSIILIIFAFQSGVGLLAFLSIFLVLLFQYSKWLFLIFSLLFSVLILLFLAFEVSFIESVIFHKLDPEYMIFLLDFKFARIVDFYQIISDPFVFAFGYNNGVDYYFGGDFGLFDSFLSLGIILFLAKYYLLVNLGIRSSIIIVLLSIVADFHYNVTTHTLSAFVIALALTVGNKFGGKNATSSDSNMLSEDSFLGSDRVWDKVSVSRLGARR